MLFCGVLKGKYRFALQNKTTRRKKSSTETSEVSIDVWLIYTFFSQPSQRHVRHPKPLSRTQSAPLPIIHPAAASMLLAPQQQALLEQQELVKQHHDRLLKQQQKKQVLGVSKYSSSSLGYFGWVNSRMKWHSWMQLISQSMFYLLMWASRETSSLMLVLIPVPSCWYTYSLMLVLVPVPSGWYLFSHAGIPGPSCWYNTAYSRYLTLVLSGTCQ